MPVFDGGGEGSLSRRYQLASSGPGTGGEVAVRGGVLSARGWAGIPLSLAGEAVLAGRAGGSD